MEYTPIVSTPNVTPPSYELKKDVTGKPPEKRGEYILTDKNGTNVKLPYSPKNDCKRCYGRGYTGINLKNGRFVICNRCYPKVG